MIAAAFVLAFLLGKLGSVLLYRAAWNNGKARRFHPLGATVTFLIRPWPWLVHIPVLVLGAGLSWRDLPDLRLFTAVAAGSLALGAAGRWGAVDLGRLFLPDRLLIVILWAGAWFSPVFLYPLLLACCALQYTVSGWPLNPGYSNLLGFEFMRSSLCMVLSALLVPAALEPDGIPLPGAEAQALALVLAGQAAGYVQQALAKCALGRHWYSWILENRLQCLAVNAWLRGWGSRWMKAEAVLRWARFLARIRVPLCGSAWLLEVGWLFILADPRLAIGILSVTSAFHLAVWLSTGLAGYHYLVSHVLMIAIAATASGSAGFPTETAWMGAACILASTAWVLLLRRHLFGHYARHGEPGPWSRALDPADHLMAWWDGPYMRMYSYGVKTASGRRYRFPVPRFSPYDTFLTDIHTHLMILGRSWDLDPHLPADRAAVPTGVWGLTVSRSDRDRLYALMDDPHADLAVLRPGPDLPPGASPADPHGHPTPEASRPSSATPFPASEVPPSTSEAAQPLVAFFQGLNRYQAKAWFRRLWLWPHFPGEDHVPDWSPLAGESLPPYAGSEPVTEVTCHCVKTFYRGDSIHRLDERVFARFPIPETPTR